MRSGLFFQTWGSLMSLKSQTWDPQLKVPSGVHGAMDCDQKDFTPVWLWHHFLSGPNPTAACPLCHIGCWLDRELFTLPSYISVLVSWSIPESFATLLITGRTTSIIPFLSPFFKCKWFILLIPNFYNFS